MNITRRQGGEIFEATKIESGNRMETTELALIYLTFYPARFRSAGIQ